MKIKDLASVQLGYSFRSRLETSLDGDVAVIQMKDLLKDITVDCTNLVKINMESVKDRHLVKKGDLVFRSRGLVANSAILLENPGKAIVAGPLFRIRIIKTELILPEYLNWYISQLEAQSFLTSRAKITTQNMISKQAIEELDVCLPSLEQQKLIVDIAKLSAKESELAKRLNEKKEQYISRTLMQFAKGE